MSIMSQKNWGEKRLSNNLKLAMEHSSMKVAGNDEDSLSVECLGWKPAYMGFL